MSHLWILSEERPKTKAITFILSKFAKDQGLILKIENIEIKPRLNNVGKFSFWYEITGFTCGSISSAFLTIVSGNSSFVDFLVFYQAMEPVEGQRPLFMVEETKTDDEESRNTGVYQRCSKFVYAEQHYPNISMSMFYNLQVDQRSEQTDTNVFGTRCLRTLGVEIAGKTIDESLNVPFSNLEELIKAKEAMRKPPAGNIPIEISIHKNAMKVSGRLYKSGGLSYDPNIGALSLIGATARKLGWEGDIVITRHGLEQKHVTPRNKFVRIANSIGLQLENIDVPKAKLEHPYWYYNRTGEKLATILLHLLVQHYTQGISIFENHAGSEKGYFLEKDGTPVTLEKYVPGSSPRKSIDIPDLILLDEDRKQILNLEGKTFSNMQLGIETLENYSDIEALYVEKYYPGYKIMRSVIIYGGMDRAEFVDEVSFALMEDGEMYLGAKAPLLFKEALENMKIG
jgi:hypothetical protein